MRVVAILCASVLLASVGSSEKKPDVQVIEVKARRDEGKIFVDGRVRVTSDKRLHGLIVFFDLMSPENNVVGSQNVVLDDSYVEPNEERSYRSETSDHVRAVRIRVRAFALGDRELRVGNSGPFPIE